MARTFRRKNIEYKTALNAAYCNPKITGRYTEYDMVCSKDGKFLHAVFREPTKQERFKRFAKFHLDIGCFSHKGMNTWDRFIEQKTDRQKHRRLIGKFMKGILEDVIPEKRSINPYWCW